MQNAGRNQPQHELRAVDVHGVPGVVAALIARDDVEARCQQVDDFAFAFVAPLRAEHCEIHHRATILLANPTRATRSGATSRNRERARPAMKRPCASSQVKNIFIFD